MPKDYNILVAGFGGQGILFAGKVIAYCGMILQKEISWLPSYGPEMRGGTANCSVCISDKQIGSPLVTNPNVFIAMNLPSLDKFIDKVEPGSIVVIDSSLIDKKIECNNLLVSYVPATKLAKENDINGLANIILISKALKEMNFCPQAVINEAISKCVSKSKSHLLKFNEKAVNIGFNL